MIGSDLPAQIILVRHGQASFGADDYDKLSDLGHRQATWLGEYMDTHHIRPDRILHGALRRQKETAQGIGRVLGQEPADTDARLDEFHYHELEKEYVRNTGAGPASSRAEFLTLFPQIYCGWADGTLRGMGESYAAFEERVAAVLDANLSLGGTTLLVTSGGVIGMAMRRVMKLDAAATAMLTLNIHNASVHRLEWEAGQLRLGLFNASPHLDPRDRSHARTYV